MRPIKETIDSQIIKNFLNIKKVNNQFWGIIRTREINLLQDMGKVSLNFMILNIRILWI